MENNSNNTLGLIEEILKRDADYTEQKGKDLKSKIEIRDTRFQGITSLIEKNEPKSNENYRKIIELISKYMGPLDDKTNFDQGTICSKEYYCKQRKANNELVKQLFNYICEILESNPDITLSADTLKKLLKKWTENDPKRLRILDFEKLANILKQNKTLEKSNISTSEIYQILIETCQLNNKKIFTDLITPEQFDENHEQVDEYLKSCKAYDFIVITRTIRENFNPEFNEASLASKNMQEHFAEDLIYHLIGKRCKNEERDYNLIYTVLSDKNRKINFHANYEVFENQTSTLYAIIEAHRNPTIINAMLNHPDAKNIYGFNSIDATILLCRIRCKIGEYEKFLNELNQNKGPEYLSTNQKIDNCFKQTGYIVLDKYPENLRTCYISTICESLKSQNVEYNRIIQIISLIINDDNLNYFEPNKVLPKLQELLSEDDFKKLLNAIAQKQKEGKLTLIEYKLDNENKYVINKISDEDFKKMIKEYVGHQNSIGTGPNTSQDDLN